jgi:hypothetical protein
VISRRLAYPRYHSYVDVAFGIFSSLLSHVYAFVLTSLSLSCTQSELEMKRAELDSANEKLRSLNETRKLLTTAEINHARSSAKLDSARENVATCRERLAAALAEEARVSGEATRLFQVVERMRHSWRHDHEGASRDGRLSCSDVDIDDDCNDDVECNNSRAVAASSNGVSSHPPVVGIPGAQKGTEADKDKQCLDVPEEACKQDRLVSVLSRSPFTPNGLGPYTSPLAALHQYVVTG